MFKFFTICILGSAALTANAQNVYSDQFQKIKSVRLIEITKNAKGIEKETVVLTKKSKDFSDQFKTNKSNTKSNIAGVIMMTKELIALGKEIYAIVEAGKPVVTMETEPIHILPKTISGSAIDAFDLQGWRAPVVRKYKYVATNYMNVDTVVLNFMLIFSYGGNLDGKGSYISGAQVKPTLVDVKWGYKLDATYKVQSIMNQGSSSNPVAAAILMFDFNMSTVVQDRSLNQTFFINGKGQVKAY